MPSPQPRRLNSLFGNRAKKQRRPAGVSRRRKREFTFETLEDRRVMSADSPIAPTSFPTTGLSYQTHSLSSATPEGQLQILLNEINWQALIEQSGATAIAMAPRALDFDDPLVNQQWHLVNIGQQVGNPDYQPIFAVPGEDINIIPLLNSGLTGQGILIAVIDTGVQLNHPDLIDNIDLNLAADFIDPFGDGSPNTEIGNFGNAHGTAVAGIIGAIAGNGIGGAGVAPGVTLVPMRVIDLIGNEQFETGQTGAIYAAALRYALQNGIHITNNSFGPTDQFRALQGLTTAELFALRDTIVFGRDLDGPGGAPALGMIHVWAAGNGANASGDVPGFIRNGVSDSSQYDGYANSRFVIAVTGVDHDGSYNNIDGTVTSFAEGGANVLVAAPVGSIQQEIGRESLIGSGITTTDLTGELGYNASRLPNGEEFDRDFLPDIDYTSRFGGSTLSAFDIDEPVSPELLRAVFGGGTSAAAAMVTGVVALMLEANPNLSWRDVQEILVRSARQNMQFETPTNGGEFSSQNLWIVNQQPIFQDPDTFQSTAGGPNNETFLPIIDYLQNLPQMYTNGAGYTVSQGYGVYGDQIGFGHGVVDAEMAVRLAQQWATKGQTLPGELTFTTSITPGNGFFRIPAAERSSQDAGFQVVPGGIGGAPGFIGFWNEYFVDDPFANNPTFPFRGSSYLPFEVPDSGAMTVESVEVKLSFIPTGGNDQLLDHMRIMLVSPDGTQSELNHYYREPPATPFRIQNTIPGSFNGGPGTVDFDGDANDGNLVWTFTTNRHWGERTDNAVVYDPLTGDVATDPLTGLDSREWRLYIENWDGNSEFGLQGIEMIWHGSPIAANTQRVQGFVGIDENRNDDFNYSRVNVLNADTDGEVRLRELLGQLDLTQEQFAGNVTVVARRASDGAIVDRFVTGHDGNYYFDLVPDEYIISIEDPEGRLAKDDSSTAPGLLDHYKNEWRITPAFFQVWQRDVNLEVPVDGNEDPLAGTQSATATAQVRGINFLLDPGPPRAPEVVFTGNVYADVNGDGAFNPNDVGMPGINVYADVNRNGVRDAGEVVVTTDANGQYTMTLPVATRTVVNIGVLRPANWTSTNDEPSVNDNAIDGIESFLVQPGGQVGQQFGPITGVNFFIDPPANNIGGGGANQPGFLLGAVFNDSSGDGVQQASEAGFAGFNVYVDNNNNGVRDAGDTTAVTNQFGAYAFANVPPGQRVVRVEFAAPFIATVPLPAGSGHVVNLTGSSTISNLSFGLRIPPGGVFNDQNGDTIRQVVEFGVPGIVVYIDDDNDGVLDAGERQTVTDASGEYVFNNLTPGLSYTLRVQTALPLVQTFPTGNGAQVVNLVGGTIIANVPFGIRNLNVPTTPNATPSDFGDLPSNYGATQLVNNGARHTRGAFWLGVGVDSEFDGTPSASATGDDAFGSVNDDEDGVFVLGSEVGGVFVAGVIVPGSTLQLNVIANRRSGYLQGWIDWNNDGDFNDAGERIIANRLLDSGNNTVTVAVPADANAALVYGRFRYGEFGINSIFGQAQTGEVEDHRFAVQLPPPPLVTGIPADFDQDDDVDGADFLSWQRNFGRTGATQQQGSADGDGDVDKQDLGMWKSGFGTNLATAALVSETGDFDNDSDADGTDFLTWQRSAGVALGATVLQGDGNGDAKVNGVDFGLWSRTFGEPMTASSSSSSAAALQVSAASSSSQAANAASYAPAAAWSPESFDATTASLASADGPVSLSRSESLGNLRAKVDAALSKALLARDAVQDKLGDAGERVRTVVAHATARFAEADLDFLRRDRAFDDLFGTRRRQGLLAEVELELPEGEDCDEAFAAIADHFEWRLS